MAEQTVNVNEVDHNADDDIIEEVVYQPESNSSSDEDEFYMTSFKTKGQICRPRSAWSASDEDSSFDGNEHERKLDEHHQLFPHHSLANNTNPNLGLCQPNEYSREQSHDSGNTKHQPSQKPKQRPVPAPRTNLRNSQTGVKKEVRTPPKNILQRSQDYLMSPQDGEGVSYNSLDVERPRVSYNQHQSENHYNSPHTHDIDNSCNSDEVPPGEQVFDTEMGPCSRRPQSNYGQLSSMHTDETENATVVVSKISPNTSADMLRMYFENKRKSGGGMISEFSLDQDVVNITFMDPIAAREVTQRSHVLDGSTISVIPGERKKPRANRPYDPCRLCLAGIPDGVTDEFLTYFVDGRTQKEEDPDISYGEVPGTALLAYPTEFEDIDHVIQNFRKRKLKDSFVKASRVQVSDSILVHNLKPGSSQQSVELYFESTKNSGGDCVREVRLFEEKDQAAVFFEDWKVVERVTKRRHTLEGFQLKVTPFYDFLGAEVSADGPTPRIPKPEVLDVDPLIAEYIFNESQIQSHLHQEMRKVVTKIEWPHEQNNDKIQLLPDTTLNKDPVLWKSWKESAITQANTFFDQYETREVLVNRSFWNEICQTLTQRNLQLVRPILRSNEGVIVLQGKSEDVKSAETDIMNHVEALEEAAERERQTVTEQIPFNSENFKLLLLCRIKEEIEQRWANVKFTLLPSSNMIECEGMQSEVLKAQFEICNKLNNLSKRSIDVSLCKSRFVNLVEDKIHEIFNSRNIHAACRSEGCKITVTGKTDADRDRAIKCIETEIVGKSVKIENEPTLLVLQSAKGQDQIREINSRKAVLVALNSNNTHVDITGFVTDVKTAVHTVEEFIEKNVILEGVVKAEKGRVRFILERKGEKLRALSGTNRQHSVTIRHQLDSRVSRFYISGTQQGMSVTLPRLKVLVENIVYQQYPVAKAGIPKLLRENKGQRFLKTVEKECECIVEIDKEFDSLNDDVVRDVSEKKVQVLRRHTLPGGCLLMVCKGDLTVEQVDGIVNAANTGLQHSGGLAKAIVVAGGESIQRESNQIIREKGRSLLTSEVVRTSPGRLPCKHVLHVAGPKWEDTPMPKSGDDPTNEENLLWDAVTNVLREAKRMGMQTISVPAISSGIFGFPIHLCAKTLVEASKEFCTKNKSCSLKEIRFTNIDDRACNAILTYCQGAFGDDDRKESFRFTDIDNEDDFVKLDRAYGYSGSFSRTRGVSSSTSTPPKQAGRYTLSTKENKTISLKKADLSAERVDVIVNTTNGNINLGGGGGVSAAILSAAGHQLQQECDDELAQQGLSGLGIGGILQTGPAALGCRAVYHTVCCSYNGAKSESVLCTLVMTILQQANRARLRSIAFPAIGTGNLKFPPNVAAKLMYETVVKFSRQNPTGSLVDIRVVLYHKDIPTIKAFEAEMQRLTQPGMQIGAGTDEEGTPGRRLKKTPGNKDSASSGQSSYKGFRESHRGTVEMKIGQIRVQVCSGDLTKESTEAIVNSVGPGLGLNGQSSYKGFRESHRGTVEMKIGQIRVQVCSGDLTKESTEAIVNSVGPGLGLNGPVSQAIIRAGGKSIEKECEQARDKGDVVKTGAGTLNFNFIIHVVTPRNLNKLKEVVGKALNLAEKERCKSIAFPALGTGNIGGDPAQAAGDLLDAIGEFASGKPKHLLLIKLTIFQPTLMKVFQDQMRSKEGDSYTAQKSFFQRGADLVKWVFSKASFRGGEEASNISERFRDGTDVDKARDTLILHIYAGQKSDLQNAKMKIDEYIEEEFTRDEIMYESDVWGELDGRKMAKIAAIARKNSVEIEPLLDGKAKRIIIEGRTVDVNKTKADMNRFFTEIQVEKKRELEDRLTNKEVEWRYKEAGTGQFTKYGDDINPLIERAYQEGKDYKDMELEDGSIRIDFRTMKEGDKFGRKTDVERVDLKKVGHSQITLPQNWIPMNPGQNSQVVPLLQTTQEYADIERTFTASIGRQVRIKEIRRIQIEDLYKMYTAKKEKMVASAIVGIQVERYAYHGTARNNCDKISTNGFNRSFHGANGTMFGKGTYFARDASYSDRYAKPSASTGYRYMFYCKILTGEYTIGNPTYIAPPAKPNNPTDLYDSVVDRHPNPKIFVIFHDTQAYPEYLIKYQ
ncbi:protein mono-ADP-ribosyltransferase PARP14-like [Amphiura filiformis]|uniref:protein mono-ADP-ribosyltransferase PARP14-like n=1 Tax=Amphiura filiformis TaxID=82378 RepID=UPI003B21347D